MSTAYLQGGTAFRQKATQEDNPYLGAPGRAGVRRYKDEQAGTDWALGFRDAKQAEHLKKHGPPAQLGDFVRRYRRAK